MEYERIVTHGDFDGLVSAAICSHVFGCEKVIFTGPNAILRTEVSIDRRDVVTDLPYPLECGLWFDHHPGNREAVKLRGIDPAGIPGRFEEKPSCARVVLDYFTELGEELPGHFHGTVDEADIIDSFDYRSVEEWRRDTPGKLVDMSLKSAFRGYREKTRYFEDLTAMIRDRSLADILEEPSVNSRIERYREEERRMIKFVEESVAFLPGDDGGELVILDFTHHKRPPRITRNLAFLIHPGALGVLTMNAIFRGGRKTNDLSVSMSLSMNMTGREHDKDIGEIMRSLGIGDGHRGAAAGTVNCESKDEMLRSKKKILARIWELWRSMSPGMP